MNHCLILLLLLFCNGTNGCSCRENCSNTNAGNDSCGCMSDSGNNSCRNEREDSRRDLRNDSCRERSFGSFTPGGTCGCEEKNN